MLGIFTSATAPSEAEKTAEQNRLAAAYGGIWQWIELDSVQFNLILGVMADNKAARLVGGEVTSSANPPSLTSDKASILANGSDQATLTVDVDDAEFAGAGKYWVDTPEADSPQLTGALVFTAGVATRTFVTNQVGIHTIFIDVVGYGQATLEIEGVA